MLFDRVLVLILLFGVWVSPLHGQLLPDRYEIIPFSATATGTQSKVKTLLQDEEGAIWIGTHDGLYRYDGFAFSAFVPPGDPLGQEGLIIRDLYIQGNYLYASSSRGLQLIHLPTFSMQTLLFSGQGERDVIGNLVYDLQPAPDSSLWLLTPGALHNLTYPFDIRESVPLPDSLVESGRTLGNICRVIVLQNDHIWLEFAPERLRDLTLDYDTKSKTFQLLTLFQNNSQDQFYQLDLHSIIYAATYEAPEAGIIDAASGIPRPQDHLTRLLDDDPVIEIYPFDSSQVELTIDGSKWIYDLNGSKLTEARLPLYVTKPESSQKLRYHLYRTSQGFTLGFCDQGLIRYVDEQQIFQPHHQIDEIFTRTDYSISQIWQDQEVTWVLHYGDGGAILSLEGELLRHVHFEDPELFAMANYWWNISRVSQDTFWVGTSEGLYWYALSSGQFGRLSISGLPEALHKYPITQQFVDSWGEVWMGIGHGNGAIRFLPDRKRFKYYPVSAEALPFRYPKVIAEDSHSDLWMGCQTGGGLVRWHRTSDTFEVIQPTQDSIFSSDLIDAITVGPDDRVYFGGIGSGLYEYHPASKRFRHWSPRQGLSSNHIQDLDWDRHGHLWIATSNGLNKLDLTTNTITSFFTIHGLPSNKVDFLQPQSDSTFFVLTANGTRIFNPDRLVSNPMTNPVRITQLEINGVNNNHLLQGSGNLPLGYDQNNLSFEISQVNLVDGSLNQYDYRLLGLYADWRPLNIANRLSLPGISPGRYQLQFRVCNNNQCQTTRRIGLQILPPFWRSSWFYLLLAVLFGLLVLGYSHIRIRNLRRRQQLRNQISADLHDDIGSSLSSIRFMTEMLGEDPANGGTRRQQLANIKEEIGQISQNLEEIIWYIKPTSDTLEEIHLKLRRFATELLEAKGVELSWYLTDDFHRAKLTSQQKRDYFLTFKEILNNIAKHAQATRVTVNIHSEKDQLILDVQDNGIGFDPLHDSGSNGMHTMKIRAQRLRGQLAISSAPGQGTNVTLRFPLR